MYSMNLEEYRCWIEKATAVPNIVNKLKSMGEADVKDAFYRELAFGTGGLRGVIGAGTNRMKIYTVDKVSQGLADYVKQNFSEDKWPIRCLSPQEFYDLLEIIEARCSHGSTIFCTQYEANWMVQANQS